MLQVITITAPELQSIISDAYKEGYIKAQSEQALKVQEEKQPKFGEIIRGVKELRAYLIFKEYWQGSISTLSKVAPQLLTAGDRKGHGLIFRKTCIDHAFNLGFSFVSPHKKSNIMILP